MSIEEFDINPLFEVIPPGYTWQFCLKYRDSKKRTLQDKDMILFLENKIRGGISSLMGDSYVKSDEKIKILFVDANNLFGWAMSQSLPYDEIKFHTN